MEVYHYLGIKYEDGQEVVVWHKVRTVRSPFHAAKIAEFMTLSSPPGKLSCINWMTEAEYTSWKKARGWRNRSGDE